MPLCRHCHPFELKDSYASRVLAPESLQALVESLEERIIPCATAVCPACDRVTILSEGDERSVVQTLVTWKLLARWVDYDAPVALPRA